MTMAKTKRTPHRPLVFTNLRGLAARVAATRPPALIVFSCPGGFPRLLKNVIIQTSKQMSQRADDLAPWSHWLCWHGTPFVPCWGEGSSSSSQHASRRVLPLADELTSRQANKQTSQQANDSASRSRRLHWHRTPFVPCWGEGSSSSSQHVLRRMLCSAKEDRYIPDWGRKMVVVVVVCGGGGGTECRTQHA
jgi:hypothetical protein